MKKIGYFLLLAFAVLAYGVYDFIQNAPAELYSKALSGKIGSSWFSSKNFNKYMTPSLRKIEKKEVQTKTWWKLVQLDNFKFPLPYRNPLFRVAPLLPTEASDERGLIYLDNYGQEILKISYNPISYYAPKRIKQKFYEIPMVDHLTSNYKVKQIWKDMFTRKVAYKYQNYKQAILDLFLLEQREAFLGSHILTFGKTDINSKTHFFFVELEGKDKDYIWERFFIRDQEKVYSFDLKTFRQSESAKVFRSFILYNTKVLKEKLVNDELAYARFESLSRESQENEVGFIHLFSAWSQIKDGEKYLKEMIYYAEKSVHLKHILPSLYAYALYRYKKVFAHHEKIHIELDGHLELQRQIEIEKKRTLNTKIPIREIETRRPKTRKSDIRKKIDRSKLDSQRKIYRVN